MAQGSVGRVVDDEPLRLVDEFVAVAAQPPGDSVGCAAGGEGAGAGVEGRRVRVGASGVQRAEPGAEAGALGGWFELADRPDQRGPP